MNKVLSSLQKLLVGCWKTSIFLNISAEKHLRGAFSPSVLYLIFVMARLRSDHELRRFGRIEQKPTMYLQKKQKRKVGAHAASVC